MEAARLQPTLWRTCRVLANRTRLKMAGVVMRRPGQTVSMVASRLGISVPVASQYLRALEARGVLAVERRGRHVSYRPGSGGTSRGLAGLVTSLRRAFEREPDAIATIYRLATAFTHPRRIDVFRVLAERPQRFGELRKGTGIPRAGLARHLEKLRSRGFVICERRIYRLRDHPHAVGRALARMAGWRVERGSGVTD